MTFLDGGFGTMVQAAGLPPGKDPVEWNLENPGAVRGVHRQDDEAPLLAGKRHAALFGEQRLGQIRDGGVLGLQRNVQRRKAAPALQKAVQQRGAAARRFRQRGGQRPLDIR